MIDERESEREREREKESGVKSKAFLLCGNKSRTKFINMTGRGTKRRGRPPKTANMDRQSAKLNYSSKKPKYLADSQVSTPSASRASSPQGSDNGSVNRRGRPSTSKKASTRGAASGSGRGRKRGGGNQNNKSYSRKSKSGSIAFE